MTIRNSWKRVIAGTLAVLVIGGAVPANLGFDKLLGDTSITASALQYPTVSITPTNGGTVDFAVADDYDLIATATAKPGYVFDHWSYEHYISYSEEWEECTYTNSTLTWFYYFDPYGAEYTGPDTYRNLTAHFRSTNASYTITFDANGGTGTMEDQIIFGMDELKLNTFTRSGYIFTGWNTKADGTGDSYSDGWLFLDGDLTEDITLYAQWIMPNVKVGAVFKAGDSMMFDKKTGVILKTDTELYNNYGSYVIKIGSIGNNGIAFDGNSMYHESTIGWVSTTSMYFENAVEGANCIKITSGSGTESDPYIVELAIYKDDATVTTAPTANELTYTGKGQDLVTKGETEDGTIVYALGESADTAPNDDAFFENIPGGTEAGDYYVWYKVIGDENHNDSKPVCVKVTIAEPEDSSTPDSSETDSSTPDSSTADSSEAESTADESSAADSKSDSKSDTSKAADSSSKAAAAATTSNPATGAAAAGMGAASLAAAALIVAKKKDE